MSVTKDVLEYIEKGWDEITRHNPQDLGEGVTKLYGVPYPYTVPAIGFFEELYYQDVYYTNVGLMLANRWQLAKNNIDNILFMIERFGWMKNSNRHFHAGCSHPPFSTIIVRQIFEHYKDKTWLYGAYHTLKKEYKFWMTKRMSPIGLNMYGGENTDKTEEDKAKDFCDRIGGKPEGLSNKRLVEEYMIFCECGQDANPRWGFDGIHTVQVDLNCLLYAFEQNMAYFCEILQNGEQARWYEASQNRKELMDKYLLCEEGYYTDYNFKKQVHTKIFSCSNFFALLCKVADKKMAETLLKNLCRLEKPFGLTACENNEYVDKYTLQWNYPMMWSGQHEIVLGGLLNYGYTEKAKELCKKYVDTVSKNFKATGRLWEKYNAIDGSLDVTNEYVTDDDTMPCQFDSTAATFLTSLHCLGEL